MSQRVADLNVVATRDDGALSSTVVAGMGIARIENPARLLLQTYLVIPPTCSRAKEKNKMMRDCKNETAMHAGRYRTTYNKVDKSKKKKELTNDAMNISYTSPPSLNRDIEEKNRK